jgi:signal transduction histidine kinase/transcriptional regulator with GAF, ATPase, and Fis domain
MTSNTVVSIDTDYLQLTHRLTTLLADARTVGEGAAGFAHVVEQALAPRFHQLVWDGGRVRRIFGPHAGAPLRQPGDAQLAALGRGELALDTREQQALCCYAPLRVRGALAGWLCLEEPEWTPECAGFVLMAASQAAATLALLEASTDQDERAVQLQILAEVGRLLAGGADLDALLEAIHTVTVRLVDAPNFYIALYDRAADAFDLVYISRDGHRITATDRWSASAGLAGEVVRSRMPLYVDDYLAECERRGLAPQPLAGATAMRAWLGVPLLARDQVIGVMTIDSTREDYTYSRDHVELFMTIAAQAAVAIENTRLYQRSERQARQLAVLNQIGRTITSSLDPDRVPSLIMEQVSELLDAEEGSLLLTDDVTGDLVFAYTIGPVGEQLIGSRLRRGAGLAGFVVANGQSVLSNDVRADARFDPTTDKSTGFVTRAILATPLRAVDGVRGVIEVLNRRGGRPFDAEDQRLLEAVSDYAVIALENARRFGDLDRALARRAEELAQTNDQLQHNLRSLTALNALGLAINSTLRSADEIFGMTARGVAEMTGALGAAVLVPEDGRLRTLVHVGTPAPFDQSPLLDAELRLVEALLAAAMTSGRAELLERELPPGLVGLGVRALLVVPLRATQRTLGCMCVYYGENPPAAPDRETVALFATQAAGAVESIELFTAVSTARDQMASVLASTREGIMLIARDGKVAIANTALHALVGLDKHATHNVPVAQFLAAWEQASLYPPEDWAMLRRGLDDVLAGRESFAGGALTEGAGTVRFVEWTALRVNGSGEGPAARLALASGGGALLVLRDITEARELERLRQDLTHMIVHDLRSPLSSVMASIELLMRGVSGPLTGNQHHVLGIANTSSLQMLEMINTLLDISRLEAGRMPLTPAPCELPPLLTRAAEQLSSLAHEKRIAVQLEFDADLPAAQADSGLVVRVVQNLLANALKFSGRDSTVLLRATARQAPEPCLLISVSDQGVGIAPKDREKIFAKFGQVGERRGGTGLGLTFCKLVVENHGGQIWVESTPGRGSTFFFTLPLVSAG